MTATQQQVQQLQELFSEVTQTNRLLVNEVLTLTKMLSAQKQSQQEMLNYLSGYGRGRPNTIMGQSMNSNGAGQAGDGDDNVPELRRARELLASVMPDAIADRELERLHGTLGSIPDSSALMTPVTMPLLHDAITDLSRYPVYPVGQTVGIDPFHSDHINKIPYAMPDIATANALAESQAHSQQHTPTSAPSTTLPPAPAQPNARDDSSIWGAKKPQVFLVEDDPTCAKIGIKFLKSMGCEVEHAVSSALDREAE